MVHCTFCFSSGYVKVKLSIFSSTLFTMAIANQLSVDDVESIEDFHLSNSFRVSYSNDEKSVQNIAHLAIVAGVDQQCCLTDFLSIRQTSMQTCCVCSVCSFGEMCIFDNGSKFQNFDWVYHAKLSSATFMQASSDSVESKLLKLVPLDKHWGPRRHLLL